jgi:putative hydrolase of the HAD superfamily
MDGIRIVFFDAGGTLLEPWPDVGEVYAGAARRYGLEVGPEEVVAAFRRAFLSRKLDGRPQDRAWWRDVVDRTFGAFGEASDPDALFEDLYAHFTHPSSWRLFEGATDVVAALQARGYRTGLLSNWDDRLPELLDGLGLLSELAPRVISYRVGVEKPHRRIYETALAEAGVAPEEALMVGDDWEADIVGARALGMRAVYVERHGHAAPEGPSIGHLADLLDLLPGANGAD